MVVGTFNGIDLYYVRTEGNANHLLDVVTIGLSGEETFLQGLPRWIQEASHEKSSPTSK